MNPLTATAVGKRYRAQPRSVAALNGKASVTGVYSDWEGSWISAAAPIHDASGNVVGVVQAGQHLRAAGRGSLWVTFANER